MSLVRVLCVAAAGVLVVSSASAESPTVLAATELSSQAKDEQPAGLNATTTDVAATAPIEQETDQVGGHRASDAALSAAKPEVMPEEVEQAEPLERPDPTLFAHINLTTQRMSVRDAAGNEYGPWKISSARGGYTTPTGTFSVNFTSRMHYSKQYHWSPMPYSVFFNRGVATHGTNATGRLGHPASHGCVRLHPKNAKVFYNLVEKHGKRLTQIVVDGKPPYTPVARERSRPRRYAEEPVFEPFGFFGAPPSYQPRQRRYRRRQYGGGNYGAW